MTEENNKKEECPLCRVSEEIISQLKSQEKEKYFLKKAEKERKQFLRVKQKRIKTIINFLIFILVVVGAVVGLRYFWSKVPAPQNLAKTPITVFYSPTCSCCIQYLSYLRKNGFEVLEEKETTKRMDLLEKYQIPDEMTACHTSVIRDYFVEGHMPVEIIKKILEDKPEIDGIVLPGMPQGSPGMPGFKIKPFQIYSLSSGQVSEYLTF